MDASTPPDDLALRSEPTRLGLPEVVERVGDRRDVPLVPASDEDVIAALGRAFRFACLKAEGRP